MVSVVRQMTSINKFNKFLRKLIGGTNEGEIVWAEKERNLYTSKVKGVELELKMYEGGYLHIKNGDLWWIVPDIDEFNYYLQELLLSVIFKVRNMESIMDI
jgi:hypothetical protein